MELKNLTQSLYQILEVTHDASQEEIHQAFLRAKHTYSTDNSALYSVFSKEEASELLRMIEDAYAVLGNSVRRKEYDDSSFGKSPTPQSNVLANISANTSAKNLSTRPPPPTLPKVAETTDIWSAEKVLPSTNSSNDPIGRTALSNFEVNPSFENEITNQQIWDGAILQKVREYKNISIDQLTKHTRIGRHYLVALEANDFHSLPAQVFVRGFVAQISRLLNLNEKIVTDSYMKILKDSRGK